MKPSLCSVHLIGFIALTACSTQIQHGLDERAANEVLSALMARGFEVSKVPEKGKKLTWAIQVDDVRATEAMQLLNELKLPRLPRLNTQALAQEVGLIDTPSAERLRHLEALEGDIEQSLETIDGVAGATVELVVPPPSRPGQSPVPSKASVLLRSQASALEKLQMQRAELKGLVAAAVEGLQLEDVVLVIDPVTIPTPHARGQPGAGLKVLLLTLSAALCCAVMLSVYLCLRLRSALLTAGANTPAPIAAPPPQSMPLAQRPIINPAIQRKVA